MDRIEFILLEFDVEERLKGRSNTILDMMRGSCKGHTTTGELSGGLSVPKIALPFLILHSILLLFPSHLFRHLANLLRCLNLLIRILYDFLAFTIRSTEFLSNRSIE